MSSLASQPPSPEGIDRGIRDQDAAAFARPYHGVDDIEQVAGSAFRLAELARRLKILPGDHEGGLDQM
jgi:hypothetical protein